MIEHSYKEKLQLFKEYIIDFVYSYIISILIDPDKYRKGLAEKALMEICEKYKTSELYARVKIKNLPSRQLFKKCGFINVESDLYLKK